MNKYELSKQKYFFITVHQTNLGCITPPYWAEVCAAVLNVRTKKVFFIKSAHILSLIINENKHIIPPSLSLDTPHVPPVLSGLRLI